MSAASQPHAQGPSSPRPVAMVHATLPTGAARPQAPRRSPVQATGRDARARPETDRCCHDGTPELVIELL